MAELRWMRYPNVFEAWSAGQIVYPVAIARRDICGCPHIPSESGNARVHEKNTAHYQ
jgi:hypothetical protein